MPLVRNHTYTYDGPDPSYGWIDDDGRLTKGKHKGLLVETVARDNPSYLEWIMDLPDTSVEEKRIIATQLNMRR